MNGFSDKVGFIWSVADLLRGPYKPAQYGRVILPLTVLRRLDCVLEPTKAAVLARAESLKGGRLANLEEHPEVPDTRPQYSRAAHNRPDVLGSRVGAQPVDEASNLDPHALRQACKFQPRCRGRGGTLRRYAGRPHERRAAREPARGERHRRAAHVARAHRDGRGRGRRVTLPQASQREGNGEPASSSVRPITANLPR